MQISKTHAKELSKIAISIAESEGLYSHSESAKYRKKLSIYGFMSYGHRGYLNRRLN